jgi:hypothetical protein
MSLKPNEWTVGTQIDLLDIEIIKVRKASKPSADYLQVIHGCCHRKVTYQRTQLVSRLRRAITGESPHPDKCRSCVASLRKVGVASKARRAEIDKTVAMKVPVWPVPTLAKAAVKHIYGDARLEENP